MEAKELIEKLLTIHPKCRVKIVLGFGIAKLVAMQSTDTTLATFDVNTTY